jgi:hypothetical protein
MRQPIKLIMKKGKLQRDGTCPIFIQYCYSSTRRVLVSTSVVIPPDFWNKKTGTVLPGLPIVSSHTARRSFCINEYLAGTPCDLIMAISGPKTEKAFRK